MAKKLTPKRTPEEKKKSLKPYRYAVRYRFGKGIPGNADPTLKELEAWIMTEKEHLKGKKYERLTKQLENVTILMASYGPKCKVSELNTAELAEVEPFAFLR